MNFALHLENELLILKGATRVVSSTPTQAVVEVVGNGVIVSGEGIEVKMLNLDEGEVSLAGKFSNIKFGGNLGKKQPLLKRIFK